MPSVKLSGHSKLIKGPLQELEPKTHGESMDVKPLLVKIKWKDPSDDWPWFWLLETRGEWLKLKGADYPSGYAKHKGDVFMVHRKEIKTIHPAEDNSDLLTKTNPDQF